MPDSKEILKIENIILDLPKETSDEAIVRCGKMLVENGYAEPLYVEGMLARDHAFSCGIGNFIAIPHGEKEYKKNVIRTGIVVLIYPQAIDWHGKPVHIVIGIAAQGEEHLNILGNVVDNIEDEDDVMKLIDKKNRKAVYDIFCGEGKPED
ncbi:MAG: PTS sugar transporter subunit IIA [Spirochaetaceae bacterium]|jgi:mannitol/fructose-specific phosphotransferase system IIA component|nr:PTS sugar transporter subunit IIA [Spirochaetaceae bacterium]